MLGSRISPSVDDSERDSSRHCSIGTFPSSSTASGNLRAQPTTRDHGVRKLMDVLAQSAVGTGAPVPVPDSGAHQNVSVSRCVN